MPASRPDTCVIRNVRPILRIEGGATVYRLPGRAETDIRHSASRSEWHRIALIATMTLIYSAVYSCAWLLVNGLV